jgi:hypothetical protein
VYFLETDHWIVLSGQDQAFIDEFASRHIANKYNGIRKDARNDRTYLKPKDSIRAGYRAEYAVARYFGLKFNDTFDVNDALAGDLEYGIEVKTTDNPVGGLYCSKTKCDLYMKRSPNTPVIGCRTAHWPWVEILGFMYARELGAFPFNKTNPRQNSGWLVPPHRLRGVPELKKLIDHWKKSFPTPEN